MEALRNDQQAQACYLQNEVQDKTRSKKIPNLIGSKQPKLSVAKCIAWSGLLAFQLPSELLPACVDALEALL